MRSIQLELRPNSLRSKIGHSLNTILTVFSVIYLSDLYYLPIRAAATQLWGHEALISVSLLRGREQNEGRFAARENIPKTLAL